MAWALVPTYPDYDAYHHLVWGRDLLDGLTPGFEDPFAPTPHPLYLGLGALLSLAGESADRLLVLVTVLSLVALVAGAFALGRALFGIAAAYLGAVFVGSSFAFLLYAVRAFVDVPFLALVVWAAALEVRRPRRGLVPMALLAAAGLLRPEAWVLAGLYWLWCLPGSAPRARAGLLALAAAGPVLWCLVDLAVTGDPLFSLTNTQALSDSLERERGLGAVPSTFVTFLADLARPPVALAGVIGLGLALRRFGARRVGDPARAAGRRRAHVRGDRHRRPLADPALPDRARRRALRARGLRRDGLRHARAGRRAHALARARRSARWRSASCSSSSRRAASAALRSELRFIERTHDELSALVEDPRVRDGLPAAR